jgi:hypothetical protein
MDDDGDGPADTPTSPDDDPRRASFAAILFYVLGFMGALALLAWIAAALLRRL